MPFGNNQIFSIYAYIFEPNLRAVNEQYCDFHTILMVARGLVNNETQEQIKPFVHLIQHKWINRPAMTIAVDLGRKATKQTHNKWIKPL